MITKMNVLDIMNESMKISVVNTNNHNIDTIAESVESQIKSLDEMNITLTFTPEMVPVVFDEATGNYFVEYDMLAKLLECGDCISLDTKYGKICFEPKTDDAKMAEPGDEPITEEEPDNDDDVQDENEDKDKNEIDESYYMNPLYCSPSTVSGICWERDALSQVILANIQHDPNRDEIDKKDCEEIPEMTMENTYIVVESEDALCERLAEITEAAKSGGVALKNGKAQLIKADDAFKNMINHGLKVVKKKKTTKEK